MHRSLSVKSATPRGSTKKARVGEIRNFTGIDSAYEAPEQPEIHLYGDGIHLTVAHKREWSYGFKPDNKTVPLPCYPESPYDHQRESSTS